MIFTQYYLDCLSQASYLVGDETTGQAVVVDPRRDVAEYLEDAQAAGLRIVGVINTHFHADFVSGHLELARETGAWIGYGDVATPEFAHRALADGERISLGDVTLEIMTTPGHTPESISVLVFEHAGDDEVAYGVLTGDALFIGDVGRPDLLASVGVSADELGRHALRLGAAQTHGPARRRAGLPGPRRRVGVRQEPLDREAVDDRGPARAQLRLPADDRGRVRRRGHRGPAERHRHTSSSTRPSTSRSGHVREPQATVPALSDEAGRGRARRGRRGSRRAPRGGVHGRAPARRGQRARWTGGCPRRLGMVFTPDQRLVLMAPAGLEQDTAMRLARIGYDNVVGYVADR
jgi:hydroxyacylglutathione hydrolase